MTINTRRSLEDSLPRALQRSITWLSGIPASFETPKVRSQIVALSRGLVAFWLGQGVGVGLVLAGDGALLPLTWTVAVGAARYLQLTIYHHCAHANVISSRASIWIGRLIATMLVIERFDSYAPKHRREHHGRPSVSTLLDPTVQLLVDVLGIRPGEPVERNMRRFLIALVSPRVHAIMLRARIASQFGKGASWANRLATGGYLALLLGSAIATGTLLAFVLGFVLPLTIGYQSAQIARLLVEHRWPAADAAGIRRTAAQHDELTVPVRCIVPLPQERTLAARMTWAGEVAFNAWIRWTVLPGDAGPAHHWHHAQARGAWANYIAASAAWEAARRDKGLAPIAEAWGYCAALRLSLESFAAATPASLVAPALHSRQLQEH